LEAKADTGSQNLPPTRWSWENSDWARSASKHLVFVIGGSYGLHPSVKAGAWCSLSMSPMTFPHQLARLMLCEQIYRALSILGGAKYHK